ncbi:hypothetical protein RI129_007337 [Pyrocoelia pectoralis]|uniref:U1-type domain-containing protein n=1 Tax=Pyrocoelia pectoralis TaxID=417401 RepID=A0AAN7ZIF2_9COLE
MDQSPYNAEKIINSFENGTFRRIYGVANKSTPSEILTQLNDIVSWLNSSLIPDCYSQINYFSDQEKGDFFEITNIIKNKFSKFGELKDARKRTQLYNFKCRECFESIKVNVEEDIWEIIQRHEHFEEKLSDTTNFNKRIARLLDVEKPVPLEIIRSPNNCSCMITLPTDFKFGFNITYFREVQDLFYVNKELKNDKVNVNGVDYYTLRIIDDNECLCFICDTTLGFKSVKSHLVGKRHNESKTLQLNISNVETFHKYWINQELMYQIHQVYFFPRDNHYTVCELCNCTPVKYETLQAHILSEKHKTIILDLFRIYRNVKSLKMQVKVYQEKADPLITESGEKIGKVCNKPVIVNGITPHITSHKQMTCDNCVAFTPSLPMKFNFDITYHPDIETSVYGNNQFSSKVTLENGVKLHIIQLKNHLDCVCLVCCCTFHIKLINEHLEGLRHMKKVSSSEVIANLQAYHMYWIGQEVDYQAHQVYFYPSSINSTTCHKCNNLNVFYDLVHHHINDKRHKYCLFENPSHGVLLRVLQQEVYKTDNIDLEESVYQTKENGSNSTSVNNNIEQSSINKPSTSSNIIANRKLREVNSEKSDSGSEDDELSDQEHNNTIRSVVQTETNNKNTKKGESSHQIFKSFDTNSLNELHTLVERRFWPHFDEAMKIYHDYVKCLVCDVTFSKNHDTIFHHVVSPPHKANINDKKKYKFYCEICNTHINREESWLAHPNHIRHQERCQKLGASRQHTLTEYECLTCRLIFFGDDMSVKRHNLPKRERGKRSKNVVLNEKVKILFNTESSIVQESDKLVKEANEVLQNRSTVNECCRVIKEVLKELYPDCAVYPFGSQVSGLGCRQSDLDLFVDMGDMYYGNKNQDSRSQVKFVTDVMKIFGKKSTEFQYLNPIASARTPIVQVYHVPTRLDCDLSFRHGLSVENTKFLRLCIELQPTMQRLILMLKRWLKLVKLDGHITTYSLSMMVIFFYQILGYFTPVHELRQLTTGTLLIIDGWGVIDFDSISSDSIKNNVKTCDKSLKQLLVEFFLYYSNFIYETDVICPLLGRPIPKSLFVDNSKGISLPLEMSIYVNKLSLNTTEHFRADSAMCIQDPFDLSHNLTKSCPSGVITKLKRVCALTHTLILTGK